MTDLLFYILVPIFYVLSAVAIGKYLKSRNQPRVLERHPYARRA